MPAIFLSEEDKSVLAEIISTVKNGPITTPRRPSINSPETDDHQAPEVYIAKIPTGGIAGRVLDIVSSEVCAIFVNIDGTLTEVRNFNHKVWNVSEGDLSEDSYVNIKRDKYGQWYADTGGGGASIVLFEITDADASGSGCVDAIIKLRACGLTSVDIGDEIKVEDEAGCFFNVDGPFLVGVLGFALLMEEPPACDPYSAETCHWVVTSLCCTLGGCP